jgi:hypothetical protein
MCNFLCEASLKDILNFVRNEIISTKYKNISLSIYGFFLLTSYFGNAQVGINTTTPKSSFEVNGSIGQAVTTVTGNTTLNATHNIVICNNEMTSIIMTLPDASTCLGRVYTIKRESTSMADVTIVTTASQKIDGEMDFMLTNAKEAVTLVSNGPNWNKMSSNDSNNVQYPMGEISYFSTTGKSISILSTSNGTSNLVACDPSTVFDGSVEFDSPSVGKLRYIGNKTKSFHVACTISVAPVNTANDSYVFAVGKNGVAIPSSKVIQKLPNNDTQSTAMHVMVELKTNDYLELYAGNLTSSGDVYIKTLNLFALGMYMGM